MAHDLCFEEFARALDYDGHTGKFTWKTSGKSAGSYYEHRKGDPTTGRIRIQLNKLRAPAHRLAWLLVYGSIPSDMLVDHINGDASDNRIANLRLASYKTNRENIRRPNTLNKSGYLGVCTGKGRYNIDARFSARIGYEGKNKHLGYFKTPEEAHQAYVEAKRRLHEGNTL